MNLTCEEDCMRVAQLNRNTCENNCEKKIVRRELNLSGNECNPLYFGDLIVSLETEQGKLCEQ